jgi:hypothetical protein
MFLPALVIVGMFYNIAAKMLFRKILGNILMKNIFICSVGEPSDDGEFWPKQVKVF